MSTIEESIGVRVPASAASEQWTEFELFPFMVSSSSTQPEARAILSE